MRFLKWNPVAPVQVAIHLPVRSQRCHRQVLLQHHLNIGPERHVPDPPLSSQAGRALVQLPRVGGA